MRELAPGHIGGEQNGTAPLLGISLGHVNAECSHLDRVQHIQITFPRTISVEDSGFHTECLPWHLQKSKTPPKVCTTKGKNPIELHHAEPQTSLQRRYLPGTQLPKATCIFFSCFQPFHSNRSPLFLVLSPEPSRKKYFVFPAAVLHAFKAFCLSSGTSRLNSPHSFTLST